MYGIAFVLFSSLALSSRELNKSQRAIFIKAFSLCVEFILDIFFLFIHFKPHGFASHLMYEFVLLKRARVYSQSHTCAWLFVMLLMVVLPTPPASPFEWIKFVCVQSLDFLHHSIKNNFLSAFAVIFSISFYSRARAGELCEWVCSLVDTKISPSMMLRVLIYAHPRNRPNRDGCITST